MAAHSAGLEIAALPLPLEEWMGAIVASLFIGKAGETLIGRLRGWKSKQTRETA